jgi:hypothetical protein
VSANTDSIKQQLIFRFENGYGASVVRGPYTYDGDRGLFELGVVQFEGNKHHLVYDTPVTDDVCGYLTGENVLELLQEIKGI